MPAGHSTDERIPPSAPATLAVFLALAFAPAYALDYMLVIPLMRSDSILELLPALLARMATPALAALAALRLVEGTPPREALQRLGLTGESTRLSWGLLGAALVLAGYTVSLAASALAGLQLGPCGPLAELGEAAGRGKLYVLVAATLAAGVAVGTTLNALAALGEELGWRGLLYPALRRFMPRWPAAALAGVVWGLWHAPLVAVGYNYSIGPLEGCGGPAAGAAAVAVFTATTTTLGLLLAALRDASGGVYAPAAAHGTLNAVGGLYASLVSGSRLLAPPAGLAVAAGFAVAWLAAALLLGGGSGGVGEAG